MVITPLPLRGGAGGEALFQLTHPAISVYPLHDGERNAINFLVDIERIYVSHATDKVDNSHDSRFKIVAMDIILTADTTDKLLRVESFGVDSRLNKHAH